MYNITKFKYICTRATGLSLNVARLATAAPGIPNPKTDVQPHFNKVPTCICWLLYFCF